MATITKSLTIESQGTYNLTFDLWSYSEWAASAGITTSYASLAALIADEKAVRQLMTVHASVDYFANCPDSTIISTVINNDLCAKWINLRDYAFDTLSAKSNIKSVMDTADKYGYGEWGIIDSTTTPPTWGPLGNVPIMTSNSAPYGNVIESGHMSSSIGPRVFDGDSSTTWVGAANALPSYVGYEFVNPIIPKKAHIELNNSFVRTPTKFVIQGSNDGFVSDIDTISEEIITTTQPSASISWDIPLTANKYYTSLRMYITEVAFYSDHGAAVSTLQFYGRVTMLQLFGFDYSEKEFATGSTRKTIYDHGVKPSGAITGGTDDGNNLTLSAVGTATVIIDKGTRTYMGGKAGLHASGTNRLKCGSGYSVFTASNMPDSNGFDISSISGSVAVGIEQTASGTFDAVEIWIE